LSGKERDAVNESPAAAADPILVISGLRGGFAPAHGEVTEALRGVSFSLRRGALTAIVGETGSGKTLTALSVVGLAPRRFVRTGGSIAFDGADISSRTERELRTLRGAKIAMVFQNSRSALNPVFRVGTQLRDVCMLHHGLGKREAMAMAVTMLARVRVTDPAARLRQYPHQLSGGTAQRVQLALALACEPTLLIMDEPTTGLDVTVQAEILELIVELTRDGGLTACMITHDLGVVAETCDDVVVMRAGAVCETGTCEQILTAPAAEYTKELLAASRVEVSAR
jgi:ABC-type glutathione transport system ATPase component